MKSVIALLAPGQGAQTPGMLQPWLELDGTERRLTEWSEATGLDLVRLGTTADAEEIKDTAVTQPLVVASTLLAAEEMWRRHPELPLDAPVAGHSVGELAAAAIAGVLSFEDAMSLAAIRGREMAAACAAEPTSMSAVLGGDQDEVLDRLDRLGLRPANRNGAGQIVAAGREEALAELAENPPENSRVRPLAVAGAFHTEFMAPAREALRVHGDKLSVSNAGRAMLSNADGIAVTDGDEILHRLVEQVVRPVRWDSCMATLGELGVTATIEFPPAGTLSGMIRRDLKGTKTVSLKTPADLDKVAEVLAEHGRAYSGSDS
ncbi:[acyl-carrier-protein] S-malonyltransferase [Actinopolyspora lacussalsi subsp. righensis]|uniref:Malonyl CoA-acyl carrier protein transacylase n=1 Tax=Actinopolyspora righensis TaxID=995060 RepID=A0A1I6YPI5_9ACTN|nr:[acyl-carrier-protein] S-malonyltransferase [Actinopolyspora righensis]